MGKVAIFNPVQQAGNVSSKVVAALERLSEAFRVLLWNEGKQHGLSPIQVQLLIFLLHYPPAKRTITFLASYFNMTKATISDAIKSLESKQLLVRKAMSGDSRSHTLHLVKEGKTLARKIEKFADPIRESVTLLPGGKQEELLECLLSLIYHLNQQLVITPQTMCLNCRFYTQKDGGHYCNLVKAALQSGDLRVDCPEFQLPTNNE
ncbi:MarR family winged helix-turn-helix transcriptional regulator [Chitinophaga japonensis]|uniref:DNA-binding MarR family transcriptional regulator n=1 Tax=Chitinophaga japonensis TaxID=104662 RepID=A0A562TET0_CHIJA|nr:MarR family winged helix-turn-helix transcriptional regulator [Chitinophaga japonensis]TWI91490.1 DNA-binding MarR family transcriptional regulator [Chitinophaga japonensis]